MKRAWAWTWSLLAAPLGLPGIGWSLERMVGLVPCDGVAAFVKEFTVEEGTTLLGASFANNDPQTVFPDLFIVRGPVSRLADGELLGVVTDTHAGGTLVNVTWPASIVADENSTYLVGVRLPNGPGKQAVGSGPALGARDCPSQDGSFVAWGNEGVLHEISIDLKIDLFCSEVASAKGSAGPGGDNFENRSISSSAPYLKVRSDQGRYSIAYGLQRATHLDLSIFDVAGRVVRTFPMAYVSSGDNAVEWDERDSLGRSVPAGVYFVALRASGVPLLTRKFVLRR